MMALLHSIILVELVDRLQRSVERALRIADLNQFIVLPGAVAYLERCTVMF